MWLIMIRSVHYSLYNVGVRLLWKGGIEKNIIVTHPP